MAADDPVVFTTEGQRSLEQAKKRVAEAHKQLGSNVPQKRVAVYLDQWNKRNFQTLGKNVGGWAKYKYGGRLTRKAKANAKVRGRWVQTKAQLLQNTGHLRLSFLPGVRRNEAFIGSDLPYSKPHQEGGKNLPQRRMLPKAKEVAPTINSILNNYVREVLR